MKSVIVSVFCLFLGIAGALAQQVLNNAIIKMKVETTSENAGGGDGGGPQIQIGGGETTIKVLLRDSMRKSQTESNVMNNITLYDGSKGITTVLTETMGERTGYMQTREEQADQRRRMDSANKARAEAAQNGSGGGPMMVRIGGGGSSVVKVEYTDAAKVINKIDCKKAIVTAKKTDGSEVTFDVWYSPDYKMPSGWGKTRMIDLSEIKGMPVMYELVNVINMGGNEITMTMHFEVTGLELNAKIADKEFELPKGYKIKTYAEYIKDNPDGGGGPVIRSTMRMGG
jgi:hypothetical protein